MHVHKLNCWSVATSYFKVDFGKKEKVSRLPRWFMAARKAFGGMHLCKLSRWDYATKCLVASWAAYLRSGYLEKHWHWMATDKKCAKECSVLLFQIGNSISLTFFLFLRFCVFHFLQLNPIHFPSPRICPLLLPLSPQQKRKKKKEEKKEEKYHHRSCSAT